jgi:hypothetical protein
MDLAELTFKPGPERGVLGFKEAVLDGFRFLESYGLKVVKKDVTFVRYEARRFFSNKVFVNIYHGRSSFEIGVEVGRRDRPEKYDLGYLVSWAGAWEAEGFGRATMFQVSSREGVQRFVPKVAELLKKYGDPFLRGSPALYRELDRANQRESEKFARTQKLVDARREAESAWSQKSFARVVELYKPFRRELTDIEAKRLAYAEKHRVVPPE